MSSKLEITEENVSALIANNKLVVWDVNSKLFICL